ncbi:MAG: response regulator [Raineya sp.]|nr:response regulator [Raineya sp.]
MVENIHHNTYYMIVDDDIINNKICEVIIKKNMPNSQIISFTEAYRALDYLVDTNNHVPDIIFLDINMPEIDGWEFLNRYEKISNQKTKLIMLSSSTNEDDMNNTQKYSLVKGFIQKPLTMQKLIQSIVS